MQTIAILFRFLPGYRRIVLQSFAGLVSVGGKSRLAEARLSPSGKQSSMPEDGEFQRRLARHQGALTEALSGLYGRLPDFSAWLERFLAGMAARSVARCEVLRARDLVCEADPGWFLRPEMIGYSCYVDRFGGTLQGVANRIPYLQSLGIRYLHLLPFWDVAEGDSDGGFAVRDYTRVAPRLGRLADLGTLAAELRAAGITLCADLVLNHTADTHPWAMAARAGDAGHRAYYHVLTDRAEVDAYEASLGEVFPHTAPGNFTHVPEMGGWVWTTFYPFQWDLNYANPAVFAEMAGIVMDLANLGVGAFRLDSAAYLWKRKGTSSRSQPETHLVMRALRAMVDIVAPSVLLKSEVIAPVEDAAAYLGSAAAPECHLAYHAGLMTSGWAALAEQNVGTLRAVIEAVPAVPEFSGWINYVRCHDDIGWQPLAPQAGSAETGFDDASVQLRLRKISDFYTEGGSFARGAAFQSGAGDAAHGINGMAASLVGLEAAVTQADVNEAIARLMLLYGVAFAAGGVPLIYMGDELGQINDGSFLDDPLRAHEGRWLHRPEFSEAGALGIADRASVAGRVHSGLLALASARQNLPALSSASAPAIVVQPDRAVLVFSRGPEIAAAFNFSDTLRHVSLPRGGDWLDILGGVSVSAGEFVLPPWGMAWLLQEA
jgi:amylosucrase